MEVPGCGRRGKKGSRIREPGRDAGRGRDPSAAGSISLFSAVSGLQVGRDSERPTQSWPCRAPASEPQADPRASRRTTAGSGFDRGRQTTVRNGRHRTPRPRRHSSWREEGVLVRPRPLHHRQSPPAATAATIQKGRTVKKPLGSATPEGLGKRTRVEAKPKMAAGPARTRTPPGGRTRRKTAGYATNPASPNVTRTASAGGPFPTPPCGP